MTWERILVIGSERTWPNHAAANPAIASLLQSTPPAGRVADMGRRPLHTSCTFLSH
jgi:hypothetical protein